MKSKINFFILIVILLYEITIKNIVVVDFILIIYLFKKILTNKIYIKKSDIFIILVITIIAFIPFIANYRSDYFITQNFFLSYSKFLIYSISLIILPRIYSKERGKVLNTISLAVKIVTILGLLQFILYYIPYTRDIILIFGESSISYGFFRITSIYAEPASFSFIVFLYLFLIFNQVKIKPFFHVLINITFILTFSLTTLGLLLIGYIIIKIKNIRDFVPYVVWGLTLMLILYLTVPLINTHITNLITLNNSSSVTRIYGGFEYAFKNINGVGLGQIENYYIKYKGVMNLKFLSTATGTVTNILAAMILTIGISGTLIFNIYVIKNMSGRFKMYIILIIYFFSTGGFNTITFFLIIQLLIMNIDNGKECLKK